ncbi:translation initiation factor if-2-related [Holotrichia oblita]|nr:translation initiation factor if-2-related [Holotrichia oblita]
MPPQQDVIGIINNVEQLSREKEITALFNSAQKAKQTLNAFSMNLKERYAGFKAAQERNEIIKAQAQKAESLKKIPDVNFAEAIAEKPKPVEIKEEIKPAAPQKAPEQKEITPRADAHPQGVVYNNKDGQSSPSDAKRPPFVSRQDGQRPPYNQGQRPPYQPGQQRPPYQPGQRPFTPRADGTRPPYQPGQRPPYQQGQRPPYQPGQRPPYQPGQRPPYQPGQPRPPYAQGQRPPYQPGAGKPAGFTAKTAKADLTSATSVFVNREQRDYLASAKKKTTYDKSSEDKKLNKRALIRRGLVEERDIEDRMSAAGKDGKDKRPPIVTVMGHVDHGKTSLLDYIRSTNVTGGEAGGITQHIAAYSINWKGEKITFIDTPGHAAFANMRARGSKINDIAILIVAADDGVKQQTIEAIKHIKSAKVPMIVAINKMDKPDANVDRIKQQLTEHDVLPEEWGGDAILVPISARTGEGIDKLIEMILLVADVQNLKADAKDSAVGTVVEARLDKGMGPVATIIVQNGTLRIGDNVVSGFISGRIRALIDSNGKQIKSAGPSMPVSILGLDGVPNAGDSIQAVDEKAIKNVVDERKANLANAKAAKGSAVSLEDFMNKSPEAKKTLKIVVKGDVQGSVEALKQTLSEVKNEEVNVEVIRGGVGNISENDVQLASVSDGLIIAFNVKVENKAQVLADHSKVEIKHYKIIYEAIEEIESRIKKMLTPKYQERVIGHAEVRALFKISSIGTIAGCRVLDGKIMRNSFMRIIRGGKTLFDGDISTLKIQKDDVKEAAAGFECGIKVKDYNDILENDILECYIKERIQ